MSVVVVVVGLPVTDHDPGFDHVGPLVQLEAFVAHTVVERFNVTVVPWLAGRDVHDPDSVLAELGNGG